MWSTEELSRWLSTKNIPINQKGISANDLFHANESQLVSMIPQLGLRKRLVVAMEEAWKKYFALTQDTHSPLPGKYLFQVRRIAATGKESVSSLELEEKEGTKLKLRHIETAVAAKFMGEVIEGFEFVVPGKVIGTPVTLPRSKQLRDAVEVARKTGIYLCIVLK